MSNSHGSSLQFPSSFPVKAIGHNKDGFEDMVVSVVRRHVEDFTSIAVNSRSSKGGLYVSVTVTFIASSREQLEAIYQELSAHEQVVMVL